MNAGSEKHTDLQFSEDDMDAKEFAGHLKEAYATDLSVLERTGCVSQGVDDAGNDVMIFIPRLGFGSREEKSDAVLRMMLLLFIKKANEIVKSTYSIVYAHTSLDILNHYPLIYKFYSILPRGYKKNLDKMYILHSTVAVRMFFEFARVFLSNKFYNKLVPLDTILDFQRLVPPTTISLPLRFLKREDEDRGLKYHGRMAPLADSFDPLIGTTKVIEVCVHYIRLNGGLTREGIFRIPGDDIALSLCRARLQYAFSGSAKEDDSSERIALTKDGKGILIGDLDQLKKKHKKATEGAGAGGGKPTGGGHGHNRRHSFNAKRLSAGKSTSHAHNRKLSGMEGLNLSSFATGGALTTAAGAGGSGSAGSGAAGLKEGVKEPEPEELPEEKAASIILIRDVDTAAQVLKVSIRDLPEPLIPFDSYDALMDVTKKYEKRYNEEWEAELCVLLADMPWEHLSTIKYIISFLREVSSKSAVSSMDSSNLAIIFSPSMFRPKTDFTDPFKALLEVKLSQTIIKELIDRVSILDQTNAVADGKPYRSYRTLADKKSSTPAPKNPANRAAIHALSREMSGVSMDEADLADLAPAMMRRLSSSSSSGRAGSGKGVGTGVGMSVSGESASGKKKGKGRNTIVITDMSGLETGTGSDAPQTPPRPPPRVPLHSRPPLTEQALEKLQQAEEMASAATQQEAAAAEKEGLTGHMSAAMLDRLSRPDPRAGERGQQRRPYSMKSTGTAGTEDSITETDIVYDWVVEKDSMDLQDLQEMHRRSPLNGSHTNSHNGSHTGTGSSVSSTPPNESQTKEDGHSRGSSRGHSRNNSGSCNGINNNSSTSPRVSQRLSARLSLTLADAASSMRLSSIYETRSQDEAVPALESVSISLSPLPLPRALPDTSKRRHSKDRERDRDRDRKRDSKSLEGESGTAIGSS